MKKILFISLFMILSAVGMAQLTGTYLKVYSKTTPVARSLPDSTVIFVKNQAAFYMTTHAMTATQTVQYMIDSSFILTIASGTSSATISDMSITNVTASTVTTTTLAVTGEASTQTLTTTGPISASGSVSAPTFNSGQGDYELYEMDQNVSTTSSPSFVTLTVGTSTTTITITPKVKYVGTDTTGHGSTENVGLQMYFNGHFYGVIAGEPPIWKQLDN